MRPILKINLKAIQDNYQYMQTICKAEVAASVKADCYGLGVAKIAPALYDVGCRKFFAATINEAMSLRFIIRPDTEVYVLNGFSSSEMSTLIDYNLTPIINTPQQLHLWMQHHPEKSCSIHIDTGMNRLGMNIEDFVQIPFLPQNTQFLMSHLACDGDKTNPYNRLQLEKFIKATSPYPHIKKSLAASGGVFLGPEYHFDIARVGAALYGLGARTDTNLQNPVTLLAPIIQIKKCLKDEYIGYGSTKLVPQGTILATIPIGYADGFLTFFSNKGTVYINNRPADIIGRISMDLTIIDITTHTTSIGENVELIGHNLYPDDIALKIGTIGYEILTSLRKGRFDIEYSIDPKNPTQLTS
jgi:alanine racemase